MKKQILIITAIVGLFFSTLAFSNTKLSVPMLNVFLSKVEALSIGECASGGDGSLQCGVSGSVAGSGVSCEVTCGSGYYACCNLIFGCSCVSL